MKKEDTGIVKSVLKALAALDVVVERSMIRSGVGLSEIAAALELQPTTVRNILKTMEQAGYIGRAGDRLYVPGPKCAGMNRAIQVGERLMAAMPSILTQLTNEYGESFVVATLFGGRRKVLMQRQGTSAIVVETRNAERDNMAYHLVTTRIMLAFAPTAELEAFIELNGLPGREWDGIDSRDELERHLEKLKMAGYAEAYPGDGSIYAAAFPILNGEGNFLGALGMFMPSFRLTSEFRLEIFQKIHNLLSTLRDQI